MVIGIDASTVRTGIGIVDSKGFITSSVVRGTDAAGIAGKARDLGCYAAGLAAIELPYLGANVSTTIKLSMAVGQWKQALEVQGLTVVLYRAGEWQSAVLGCGPRTKRAERKAAALLWAKRVFGVSVSEDEADALGLAFYALRKARLTARPRAA